MSSRISYVKSRKYPGMLYSRGHISKKYGTRYDVEINTNDMSYEIRNITSNRVVKRGKANPSIKFPLHSLKIKVKKELKVLQIEFKAEVRRNSVKKEE